MLLYVPKDLPAGSPLVVVLHGCYQQAQSYAEGAGWLALSDRFRFAVLCPEQTYANNSVFAFNWFLPEDNRRGSGEVHSIQQMILSAIDDHDLAADLVFITGLSSGGAMTVAMLAAYPELFAAGAPIAGLAYGAAANAWEAFGAMYQSSYRRAEEWGDKVRAASIHSGRWPAISVWHGGNDSTVTPGAADSLVRQWINVHGVEDSFIKTKTAGGREYRVWRSAVGRSLVEMHLIVGMSHGTPLNTQGLNGCGKVGEYLLEVGVSSTMEIASSWGLPEATIEISGQADADLNEGMVVLCDHCALTEINSVDHQSV